MVMGPYLEEEIPANFPIPLSQLPYPAHKGIAQPSPWSLFWEPGRAVETTLGSLGQLLDRLEDASFAVEISLSRSGVVVWVGQRRVKWAFTRYSWAQMPSSQLSVSRLGGSSLTILHQKETQAATAGLFWCPHLSCVRKKGSHIPSSHLPPSTQTYVR